MPNSFSSKQLGNWNHKHPVQTRKSRIIHFIVETASWVAAAFIFFLVFEFVSSLF